MGRRERRQVSILALGTVDLPARQADAYEAVRSFPLRTALQLEELTGYKSLRPRLLELEAAGVVARTQHAVRDERTNRYAHQWFLPETPVVAPSVKRRTPKAVELLEREVRHLQGLLAFERGRVDELKAELEVALAEVDAVRGEVLGLERQNEELRQGLPRWPADLLTRREDA